MQKEKNKKNKNKAAPTRLRSQGHPLVAHLAISGAVKWRAGTVVAHGDYVLLFSDWPSTAETIAVHVSSIIVGFYYPVCFICVNLTFHAVRLPSIIRLESWAAWHLIPPHCKYKFLLRCVDSNSEYTFLRGWTFSRVHFAFS